MSNGNGHRWSKFWWQDWRNDPALRMCGLAARGLWIELLGIMHEADGYLLVNGRQPLMRQIAAMVGAGEKEVTALLHELGQAGVFSRGDDGTIYSRRMVKDAAASEAGREHIAKRWNGHDPNSPPNRGLNREPTSQAYRHPTSPPISPSPTPPSPSQKQSTEADPPRSPPRNRGGTRRGGFAELERRLQAAETTTTIDATAEEVADFQAFRRRLAGGANG
jgi:hypothetical protein